VSARRLIPIGAAVTALLVLAGAASHGRPLSPGTGAGPSATFFDYVATTLVVFAVFVLAVVAYALLSDRAGGGPPRRGRWNLLSALIMIAGAALFAYLISSSKFEKRLKSLETHRPGQAEPRVPPAHVRKPPTDLRNARIRWDEIAIVLVLVAGIGVYFYVTRAPRRGIRPLARRRDALSQALDDSLDDLRNDPDIRRAIIAAYARMERALAASGMPRAPAEAPYEYLERSLVELDAGADGARRLTDLFQRAKFSHHEPAEAMRQEAIDALIAVRDDLRREPVAA
jgi:hypothetical protein